MTLAIGDPAPDFELEATDGTRHSPRRGVATVVVFTCNHCPYALAWHDRLMDVARDYADRGVRVLSICSNDPAIKPADSFEAMRERVEADGGWPSPYLWDGDQSVARAYGARTTPHVFVIDGGGRIAYQGAPDADWDDPSLRAGWLRAALDALLAGDEPDPAQTEPVGCSIKWRR